MIMRSKKIKKPKRGCWQEIKQPLTCGWEPNGEWFCNKKRKISSNEQIQNIIQDGKNLPKKWLDHDNGMTKIWLEMVQKCFIEMKNPYGLGKKSKKRKRSNQSTQQ